MKIIGYVLLPNRACWLFNNMYFWIGHLLCFDDTKQDYAWVTRGMIFPFIDYVDRCAVVVCLFVFIVSSLSFDFPFVKEFVLTRHNIYWI